MKLNHFTASNHSNNQANKRASANVDMLSRQIESLRIVLRRVKTTQSSSLNLLIHQKLKEMQN
jgi:hypothetical protein